MPTPVLKKLGRTLMCNKLDFFRNFCQLIVLKKKSPVTKWENVECFLSQEYPTLSQHPLSPLAERLYFKNPSEEQDKSPLQFNICIHLLSTFKQNCLCWPKSKDENWYQPDKATPSWIMLFLNIFKAFKSFASPETKSFPMLYKA